jgi:hypothetical protein
MRREIWAFVILAAILLLLFRFSGGDWRGWRERLFTAPEDSTGAGKEDMRVDGDYAKVAGEMQNYVDWLHEAGISDRLERISDSLHAVLGDLEERREKVEKAGSLAGLRESESYDEDFWKAARSLQELERASVSALVDVDSIRTRLVLDGERKAPSVSRAAEIRWNEPERVGVREACLSCHQELDGSGQVLLTPGRDNQKYPEPMLHHSPREFGCTVCHRGAPQALDFERSHGLDHQGRSFRPGKLALRSCGLCHDRIAKAAARMTEWPEACVNCHAGQSLAGLSPDSLLRSSGHDPVTTERNARTWLVRHWSVKTGRIPERENFEQVFSSIISGNGNHGRLRDSGKAEDSGAGLKKGTQLICPSCGRRFRAAGDMAEYFCPLDGTKLERLEKE